FRERLLIRGLKRTALSVPERHSTFKKRSGRLAVRLECDNKWIIDQFYNLARFALVVRNALSSFTVLTVWTPVAWSAAVVLLFRGGDKNGEFAFWFFLAGCFPLIVSGSVGIYFAITNPALLRSEEHEHKMAKLELQKQGAEPIPLEAATIEVIENPAPRPKQI